MGHVRDIIIIIIITQFFIVAWQRSALSECPHWPGYNPINSLELAGPPQRAEAPGGITISSGSVSLPFC